MSPDQKTAAIVAAIKKADAAIPPEAEQVLTIALTEVFTLSDTLRKIEGHFATISKGFSND